MELASREVNEVTVVDFKGKLNTGTSPDAEKYLTALADQGAKKMVLNFAELDYVSSTGLRVILFTGKKLSRVHGELRLCSLNATVAEILDMSGFSAMFKVFDTLENALQDF